MSARGRKNIVILPAENIFRVVANGGHEGHESKGSHLDKLKFVKSVISDVYKKHTMRTTGVYVHIGLNGLNGCRMQQAMRQAKNPSNQ